MTTFLETHRSFVNRWECDENDHMNVQFYFKRFDEAARFFDHMSAGGPVDAPLPASRHVRYHAEMRDAAGSRIRSTAIADGPLAGWSVHLLEDTTTGTLCASALDTPSGLPHRHRTPAEELARAMPRGVGAEPQQPMSADAILAHGGLAAHRRILQPHDCDAAGRMLEQTHVAMFSDAAPHAWEAAGVDIGWLEENNCGRVAVEMKITHHREARAGEALMLHAAPIGLEGKAVRLRHEIARLDGSPVATGEVMALVVDLATRRSVAMPGFARAGRTPA